MSVVVKLPKLTKDQYEKISATLMPTSPPGLLAHVSYESGDGVEGFQVWESQEAWGADIGRTLPVLQANGVNADPANRPEAAKVLALAGSKVQQ
jgi:hypothetical protein